MYSKLFYLNQSEYNHLVDCRSLYSLERPEFGCYHVAYVSIDSKHYCLHCAFRMVNEKTVSKSTPSFVAEHFHDFSYLRTILPRFSEVAAFCDNCKSNTIAAMASLKPNGEDDDAVGCRDHGNKLNYPISIDRF